MSDRTTPKLLVSVRSVDEARAALAGGADLIDIKEPSRGPLGAADATVIRDIVGMVAGQAPVSAALGEWLSWRDVPVPPGLQYAKWGLAGLRDVPTGALAPIRQTQCATFPVLVAYADHRRAESPDPGWVVRAAIHYKFPALLIDTAQKDGSTLMDWIAPATLARARFDLADAGVAVALAGSLDEAAIRRLASLEPDWFAVRGAACEGGRLGPISADRVRCLREVIRGSSVATVG